MQSIDHRETRFLGWMDDHRGILVKVARSFASEPADQEELIQEMAVQLWQSLNRFQGQSKPGTWIYRICLNTALVWQRGARRRALSLPLESVPDLKQSSPNARQAGETNELLEILYRQVRALPPSERSLAILHLDGLSYREIGEITGASENHVGVALNRVRKKLAKSMEEIRCEL